VTEHTVATLLREAASVVEAPDYVAEAQRRAREVVRRRRAFMAGSVIAAVAVSVGVAVTTHGTLDRSAPTQPGPTASVDTTTPTTASATARPLSPAIAQPKWSNSRIPSLTWASVGLPRLITGSPLGLPALSEDPVHRALAAVEATGGNRTGIVMLGDDGAWRRVDVDLALPVDAGGYSGPALWPGSLSPDGTSLAVPQPQSVVVVDLTSATSRTYTVPGFNQSVTWSPDETHVLLTTEERAGGSLVDVTSGSVTHVPYGSGAAFAPDGAVVEVTGQGELREYPPGDHQPRVVEGVANLSGNLADVGPAVSNSLIAGVTDHGSYSSPRGPQEWGGVLVLSRSTGDPVALLPMHNYAYIYQTTVLAWIDDATVLLHIPATAPTQPSQLVTWNYQTGQLKRVSELPSLNISVASNLIS